MRHLIAFILFACGVLPLTMTAVLLTIAICSISLVPR